MRAFRDRDRQVTLIITESNPSPLRKFADRALGDDRGEGRKGQLEPGFCDPVQITPRAWNDAAFFVEFEKRPESIPFRLGVYADLGVDIAVVNDELTLEGRDLEIGGDELGISFDTGVGIRFWLQPEVL